MRAYIRRKSWKREIAGMLLIFSVLALIHVIWRVPPQYVGNYSTIISVVATAIITPCLAVFAYDAHLKNKNGG